MSQRSSFRVKSGIPWWLWLLMTVVSGGVIGAVVVSLIPVDAEAIYRDALVAYDSGEFSKVCRAAVELEQFPDYADKCRLVQGLELISHERPLKAVPLLKEAARNPEIRPLALAYAGQALMKSGEFLKAIEPLTSAIEADDTVSTSRVVLSNLLYELGAFDESLRVSAALLDRSIPELAATRRIRARIFEELGQYADAAAELQAVMELDHTDPSRGRTALLLMKNLNRTGDFSRSLEYAGIAEPPAQREAARAEALLGLGRIEEAVVAVQKAHDATASLREAPGGVGTEAVYDTRLALGRLALKIGKEKAVEILPGLREGLRERARDVNYHRMIADVAALAELPEEAKKYADTHERLNAVQDLYIALRAQVTSSRSDVEGRIRLAELAADLGHFEKSEFWYQAAEKVDQTMKSEIFRRKRARFTSGAARTGSTPGSIWDPTGLSEILERLRNPQ